MTGEQSIYEKERKRGIEKMQTFKIQKQDVFKLADEKSNADSNLTESVKRQVTHDGNQSENDQDGLGMTMKVNRA